jgi:hypothetical protein
MLPRNASGRGGVSPLKSSHGDLFPVQNEKETKVICNIFSTSHFSHNLCLLDLVLANSICDSCVTVANRHISK